MKNKIVQRSLKQVGAIIFRNKSVGKIKVVPYFQENPISAVTRSLHLLGEGWRCTNIFTASKPEELNELEFSEYNMNFIRTGFQDVEDAGFNKFMNKGIYK